MEKVVEKKEADERPEETCGCTCDKEIANDNSKKWEKPTLEDVSGRVMAQPYIRFT